MKKVLAVSAMTGSMLLAGAVANASHRPRAHPAAWYSQIFNKTWYAAIDDCNNWRWQYGQLPYQANYINPEVYGPYAGGVWYGHGFFIQEIPVPPRFPGDIGVIYLSVEMQYTFNSAGEITNKSVVDDAQGRVNVETWYREHDL